MTNITIVLCSDNNFSQHLATTISSIVENKNQSTLIDFFVVDGGISEVNKNKITMLVDGISTTVKFCKTNFDKLNRLVTRDHLRSATYYRLAIPDILPQKYKKVLYLDCDMIITGDLTKLFETNIELHHLACVKDPLGYTRKKTLDIPDEYNYFNAGMLLINLDLWRKDDISNRVIDYIHANTEKIIRCDQDGLNALLYDKWLPLEKYSNFQDTEKFTNSAEYDEVLIAYKKDKKPLVIHYSSSRKPRQYGSYRSMRAEYFKYLEKTSWKLSRFQKCLFMLLDPIYYLKKKLHGGIIRFHEKFYH